MPSDSKKKRDQKKKEAAKQRTQKKSQKSNETQRNESESTPVDGTVSEANGTSEGLAFNI